MTTNQSSLGCVKIKMNIVKGVKLNVHLPFTEFHTFSVNV